jgi:hypothetical protein
MGLLAQAHRFLSGCASLFLAFADNHALGFGEAADRLGGVATGGIEVLVGVPAPKSAAATRLPCGFLLPRPNFGTKNWKASVVPSRVVEPSSVAFVPDTVNW